MAKVSFGERLELIGLTYFYFGSRRLPGVLTVLETVLAISVMISCSTERTRLFS